MIFACHIQSDPQAKDEEIVAQCLQAYHDDVSLQKFMLTFQLTQLIKKINNRNRANWDLSESLLYFLNYYQSNAESLGLRPEEMTIKGTNINF